MTASTYSIVRNHRDTDGEWDKIEAAGLDWETASERCVQLEKAEKLVHPEKTSWTRDVFWPLLEDTDRHKKLLSELSAR